MLRDSDKSSGEQDLTHGGCERGSDRVGSVEDDGTDGGATGGGEMGSVRQSGATIVGTLKSGLQMLTCGKIRGGCKLVMVTVALSTQAVLLVAWEMRSNMELSVDVKWPNSERK
ncbi:hypothetical protein EDD15DRAFT_2199739 [Pisolithus albus]|nr:hypothetical protein EDD15DRAFT_2199739 [Pisolithus albus]